MIVDPKEIPYQYDQVDNFLGGVDTSKAPDLIQQGYSSFAVNTTFRGGKPQTRPAFKELVLPAQEHLDWFRYKKYQGDTLYQDTVTDVSYMVSVRGGKVFKIDLSTGTITSLGSETNDASRRHYFQQVDKFLIIQNGVDIPLIYDGSTMRRARTEGSAYRVSNKNVSIINTTGDAVVTTTNPHGLAVGDFVTITGPISQSGYIGNYRVLQIVSDTQYRIAVTSTLNNETDPNTSGTTYRPKEVPVGLYMEYTMGRLCVVSPDRKTIRIGDLIRTTPDTAAVDSVLWFTDEDFLAESYVFSLPTSQGRIRAIATIPDLDNTYTGQGNLFIAGNKGISTLNLGYPRNEWISKPIQKIALTGVGAASHTGIVGYNGDLLFRDIEYGVRSFRLAGARFTKSPSQAPLSAEMNRLFLDDDIDKLMYTCMEVFDNRLICTVTPVANYRRVRVMNIESIGSTSTITFYDDVDFIVGDTLTTEDTALDTVTHGAFTITEKISSTKVVVTGTNGANQTEPGGVLYSSKTGAEYYHRGIAALDYTSISGAGGETFPAWEGLWTGLNVQAIVKAEVGNSPRCFVTHYNETLNRNEIWEITRKPGPDLPEGYDEENPIYPEALIELRSLSCNKPFNLKRLLALDLFLIDMTSVIKVWVYYRNDGDPCWWDWTYRGENSTSTTAEVCATVNPNQVSETSPTSDGLVQSRPQNRILKLGQPYINCKSTSAQDGRLFFETQLKIKWTGIVTWDKIRLMALEQIEDMRGRCY